MFCKTIFRNSMIHEQTSDDLPSNCNEKYTQGVQVVSRKVVLTTAYTCYTYPIYKPVLWICFPNAMYVVIFTMYIDLYSNSVLH